MKKKAFQNKNMKLLKFMWLLVLDDIDNLASDDERDDGGQLNSLSLVYWRQHPDTPLTRVAD